MPIDYVSHWAAAHGLATTTVDGNDVKAVFAAAVKGGYAGKSRLHILEQRPFGLGAQILQREPVVHTARRIDDLHHGVGIGEDVLASLAEELKGQCDVRVVHIVHLRQVGHVGCAVQCAGGELCGDCTLEAAADGFERGTHDPTPSWVPALGPGVWSNISTGSKVTAKISSPGLSTASENPGS
jgi:hypothetical protein